MWGKLTERSNRTQAKLIPQPAELYRFLVTPGVEVQNMLFANDDVVWISWQYSADERVPSLRHTNEVIGVYVDRRSEDLSVWFSRQAARKCHLLLYRLCDIHTARTGMQTHANKTDDNLRQRQSELKKDEIIDGGLCRPKKLRIQDYNSTAGESKTVCKVRGITLNYSASQLVNFEKIKDMILSNKDDETVIVRTENKIKRKKNG